MIPAVFARRPRSVRMSALATTLATRRSRFIRVAMPGRSSFTTAWRPSGRVTAWTWPTEAADSGRSSMERNNLLGSWPRSLVIVSRTSSKGNGGTSDRQR
ncbi:MAG: hypothetical protein M5U19_06470 [Microthrixaceae bacterium]|nr:hypothetical protein [Microthrixaceae bacterium]